MTVVEIRERVQQIRAVAGDNETAHGAEDALHQDLLRAIARGECKDPEECARCALDTLAIPFKRYYG